MFLPQTLDVALVAAQQNKNHHWMQVSRSFENALTSYQWRRFWDRILFRSNKLKTFDEAMQNRRLIERSDLGARVIPLDRIIGSMGRQQDFDRRFMPRGEHLKERWQSVDLAYCSGVTLPMIELLKVDEAYYVVDGHHRISVARYHGQQYMEAHVVEIHTVVGQTCGQTIAERVCIA